LTVILSLLNSKYYKYLNAIIIDNIWVIYLLGEPDNKDFNTQSGEIIRNYVFPNLLKDKNVHREWILVFFSNSWISKVETELGLTGWFEVDIWHYKLVKLKYNKWRKFIPDNYKLEKTNESFLSKTYLKNHESITNWIYERWKNTRDFFQRGICFCLIKENKEIVSWCMSDWSTEDYILLGITTDENYRGQGYASIVAAAAAEYCIKKHKDVRWFCAAQNIASWKTAEKVGFRKIREQRIIIGEFI